MTTDTFAVVAPAVEEADTQRTERPAQMVPVRERRRSSLRLADMDLDPPEGPVPPEVIAWFAEAVERRDARDRNDRSPWAA